MTIPSSKQELFAELIMQCGNAVYNFAFRLAGNESDANDLVQEAFLRAFKNISSYDPEKPFQPWLYQILRNVYIDSVRRYEKTHVVSMDAPSPAEDSGWDEVLPDKRPEPLSSLSQRELDEAVQWSLGQLEISLRSAVILSDMEGLSYEQISQVIDCPLGTVRSRIHRGRMMIRKNMLSYMESGKKETND